MTAPGSDPYATVRRLLGQGGTDEGAVSTRWLEGMTPLMADRQVDLDEVLRAIVDETARQLAADRATFYLVDHATRELVSRVAHLPEIAEIRLRLGEGVAGWVALEGQPLAVGEHDADPRQARRIDRTTGYRTRNLAAVPVRDLDGTVVGVLQVLNKPGDFTPQDTERLQGIASQVATLLDNTSLRSQLRPDHRQPLAFRFNHIVGDSAVMQAVYERVERAARTDATVLIRGETGTGKELFAKAIHHNGPRRQAAFVKVDCAALPATLIENELFGHERGAFTGADRESEGKVAAASGGTLFLDEVGELPLEVQGKLLRLLADRTYQKVGGTRVLTADLRFVCATHRDLERQVAAGRFRQDLYYRLRVVELALPPLRARGHSDIDRLVDHFLYEFTRRHRRRGLRLSPEARARLHAWSWPGNVRELEHCIESAVVLSPGDTVGPEALNLGGQPAPTDPDRFSSDLRPLREVEQAYIRHVLDRCEGNKSEAARVLGIGRNTLARKLD